jgi:NADH-quinone oxidoreductase subunit N
MTGSLAISSLAETGARLATDAGFAIAILLVLAGLAYKMAAVPMHFWVPDVYQGAPTSVTAFLSVSSKAAGFAVFLRFMAALVPGREGLEALFLDWKSIVAVASALTMTVGNLAALFQTNIKRMLGYSSIAHAGYLLMGVAALDASNYAGFKAVAFYLVVYLFTNLGAFAVVVLVSNHIGTEEIEGYRGLGSRMKLPAFAMAVFFFSLIGMPPTAGFTGKFLLFRAAIDENLYWLAMFGGVNTAVSVYYYFRVLKAMYLDGGEVAACPASPLAGRVLVALLAIPVFYLFFFGSLASWTQSLAFVGN